MTTPAVRLRAAREGAGFKSARAFSQFINIPYTTYKADEDGTRQLKRDRAAVYAAALSIPVDQLLKSNLNSNLLENGVELSSEHGLERIALLDITDLERVGAILDGRPLMPESFVPCPSRLNASNRAFAFIVPNHALADARPRPILQGDIAYIDPEQKWGTGDIVAALADAHPEILLRKFREVIEPGQKSSFELVATSDDFRPLSSAVHKIKVIGKFIGLWMTV